MAYFSAALEFVVLFSTFKQKHKIRNTKYNALKFLQHRGICSRLWLLLWNPIFIAWGRLNWNNVQWVNGLRMSKMLIKMPSSAWCPEFLNRNSNRISFILFSASNLRLLSKIFNFSETYNANGSPASFGLSKTSMHFAINFCFCSVGFTRLRLALFSTRDLLESEFNESYCASSSCSLSPSMTNCGFENFKVEVFLAVFLTGSTKHIFSMNGQELS